MEINLTQGDVMAIKKEFFFSLHCALPGTVENFDAETQTATVRPAVKHTVSFQPGGASGEILLPLLHDVPVFMPVPFDVHPGDICLLVFADCDIDAWFESGQAEEPASKRMHSLSDAFAFVGFKVGGRQETGDS